MKITIKDTEITLKYGFKALMIYEQIAGKSFQPTGLTDMLTFFYACFLAGGGIDLKLGFEEFIEWLDQKPEITTEYYDWLMGVYGINEQLKEPVQTPRKSKKKVSQ